MAIELKVPEVGESISEVEIAQWLKSEGDKADLDEPVVVIESEKATVELPAPVAGTVTKVIKRAGETARVGEVIGYMEESGALAEPKATSNLAPKPISKPAPGQSSAEKASLAPAESAQREPRQSMAVHKESGAGREEEVVPMSPLRRRIGARLVEAQRTAALLTTFNEIDMSALTSLRKNHQEGFQAMYGVKLGFMSFFVKSSIEALKLVPQLNAEIRGDNIVYRNYHDIGIAVGGGKGLVVPVLRDAGRMSFAEIERTIRDLALRAEANTLKPEELRGGTFTISNGGVYGSLLSTPIVNPPQSGVLGMHAVQDRPVARDGHVVIRPMMYVAVTYDHRIVDGREAVTFLKRIKECIEAPWRILVEV
jgi:2-oxoglutarate dehydrogenase E2 component (dihydrolipoamide succinyltransferase)